MFLKKEHGGCKNAGCAPKEPDTSPDALTSKRTIEDLGERDAVLGAEVAARLKLDRGDSIDLLGEKFQVIAALKPTGTADDSRVFAHLHTVQELAKTGEVVSAIEVLGCCEDAAGQLVPQLSSLLPDSKIVTISQVVQTQVGVNRLMSRASALMLVVLVLVGGASVLGAISSNVRERCREIGTLMALGATPGLTARLFLLKAAALGVIGGVGGSVLGTALAVVLGPRWAGVNVSMLPQVGALACVAALLLTLAAAYWPARQAALLDPCTCFQEV
jgi:putative ABC transport system permease protein